MEDGKGASDSDSSALFALPEGMDSIGDIEMGSDTKGSGARKGTPLSIKTPSTKELLTLILVDGTGQRPTKKRPQMQRPMAPGCTKPKTFGKFFTKTKIDPVDDSDIVVS